MATTTACRSRDRPFRSLLTATGSIMSGPRSGSTGIQTDRSPCFTDPESFPTILLKSRSSEKRKRNHAPKLLRPESARSRLWSENGRTLSSPTEKKRTIHLLQNRTILLATNTREVVPGTRKTQCLKRPSDRPLRSVMDQLSFPLLPLETGGSTPFSVYQGILPLK